MPRAPKHTCLRYLELYSFAGVPPAHLAVVGAETLPSASSGAKELISGSSDQRLEIPKTP